MGKECVFGRSVKLKCSFQGRGTAGEVCGVVGRNHKRALQSKFDIWVFILKEKFSRGLSKEVTLPEFNFIEVAWTVV